MPWRIEYNPSLSGERGLYPLCARYQGYLDIGFFIAPFSTHLTLKAQPRGPPFFLYWRNKDRHPHNHLPKPHEHQL